MSKQLSQEALYDIYYANGLCSLQLPKGLKDGRFVVLAERQDKSTAYVSPHWGQGPHL
jgi:hypothetical protein